MIESIAMSSPIDKLFDSVYSDNLPGFVPFIFGDETIGWIRPRVAEALRKYSATFDVDLPDAVRLRSTLRSAAQRSSRIAEAVHALAAEGIVSGWRNELYAVWGAASGDPVPLFTIERAAARVFGITSYAVHVNGIALTASGPALWIARRSATKAVDPGMLDNMIGGGLAHGSTVRATLLKEAWEEAGLDAATASAAVPGRRLRIRREVPEGLQSEIVFVHDLLLPHGVAPCNQDGEVSEFRLLPAADVIALLASGNQVTADASLVTLDWLDRAGILPLPATAQARAIFETAVDSQVRYLSRDDEASNKPFIAPR